jgi:hypothetical protein
MTLRVDDFAPDHLRTTIVHLFTDHPASVGETYLSHMLYAFSVASLLLRASLACFVHGMLPFLFTSTASRTVRELYDHMVRTRRIAPH